MKIFRAAAVFAVALAAVVSLTSAHSASAADLKQLNIWWPANGVQVSGSQPFKAVLDGMDVSQYLMYWKVDAGQLNLMASNYADYPHKEALVDLSGWTWKGQGPYQVQFQAYDGTGNLIGVQTISISVTNGAPVAVTPAPTPTPVPAPTPTPIPTPLPTVDPHVRDNSLRTGSTATPVPSPTPITVSLAIAPSPTPSPTPTPTANGTDPLSGAKLYVNPYSDPARWVSANQQNDPADSTLMAKIANQPESEWFGDWNSNIQQDVQNTTNAISALGAMPVYVIYDIPLRDCGSYSAGGASSPDAYRAFINGFVNGVGNHAAAVILEPDALANMDCLSQSDQNARLSLLNYAVTTLEQHGLTVYIDAGNPHWQPVDTMAARLTAAGVAQAQGFALNVSNFFTTADNTTYGSALSQKLGGKHFVIDTGRNGSGPTSDYQWCNPSGRSLGSPPTTHTGNPLIDAYLWVKGPGGSDGQCNGGPSAGTFWPSYALDLSRDTSW